MALEDRIAAVKNEIRHHRHHCLSWHQLRDLEQLVELLERELAKAAELHPETLDTLRFFEFDHLPPHLQHVSRMCAEVAHTMVEELPDTPQLRVGLRKLLAAKDCFVRASL
jgi:hypothetical protein